jgi:hypothetical protein
MQTSKVTFNIHHMITLMEDKIGQSKAEKEKKKIKELQTPKQC